MEILTKELHKKLLMSDIDTIIVCIKEHTASYSGILTRYSTYTIGQEDRLKYVFFMVDTFKNWKIKEIK
jgi:hypothetical protein